MGTRFDVSAVPPQGGYIAKQCPVRAQNEALLPGEEVPPSPVVERRMALGRAFEDMVVGELLEARPDAVLVSEAHAPEREAATLAAMKLGAALIIGGRLPADEAGRRVGEPDLLIRAAGESIAYRAVDVKHHRTLEVVEGGGARCSEFASPEWEAASGDPELGPRRHRGDLLQLAHYQRMLEAAGFAVRGDTGARAGGIIGVEGRVVWWDLDAPLFQTPSSTGRKKRSPMDVYDFEFDFRLDTIAVTTQHLADDSVELLLVPVKIGECPECPWWEHCGPQLEAGAGDVSLLPRIGWSPWKVHRDHGVRDRADLARLDYRTATLVAAEVDTAHLVAQAALVDPATPVADIIGARKKAKVASLHAAGVLTAADARELCTKTAAYPPGFNLPEQIDQARAALGPEPVYRRRGCEVVGVERGDVEVDIDLENVEEGVYLWGALVTDRAGAGVETGYREFVSWDPMVSAVEVRTFERLWEWLSGLRAEVHGQNRTLRVYCYHETIEKGHLRRLALVAGRGDKVSEFLDSGEWVDLLKVWGKQFITGHAGGLKDVAPLAGYAWPVDDPGGAESMLRYEEARAAESESAREAARRWLVDYNRGDVEATAALREWIDANAASIPGVESAPIP